MNLGESQCCGSLPSVISCFVCCVARRDLNVFGPQIRWDWRDRRPIGILKMEVAAGLEPAKTGFADQRLPEIT